MASKTKTGAEGITWDLSDLYSGIDDPTIENDLKELEFLHLILSLTLIISH